MKNKYIIKLNDKIISRRNTSRIYNYCWVRVIQRQETTYFYKNTGETITIESYFRDNKKIILNGQKVNQSCRINGVSNDNEPDALNYMQFEPHIDKTKTVTKLLNENYVFNVCGKDYLNYWDSWQHEGLLFSQVIKFSEKINDVRTAKFKYYSNDVNKNILFNEERA